MMQLRNTPSIKAAETTRTSTQFLQVFASDQLHNQKLCQVRFGQFLYIRLLSYHDLKRYFHLYANSLGFGVFFGLEGGGSSSEELESRSSELSDPWVLA